MNKEKFKDNLLNADSSKVANCVMAVANSMQSYDSHIQLVALCYAFITWCQITKQNPQDIFTATNNISTYNSSLRPEFLAVKNYLIKEVVK